MHHVQRYVMDRLFWANPEVMKGITGKPPWQSHALVPGLLADHECGTACVSPKPTSREGLAAVKSHRRLTLSLGVCPLCV